MNEGSKLMDSRIALAKEVEGVRRPRGVKRSRTVIITIPKSRRVIFVESEWMSVKTVQPWRLNRSAARIGLVVLVADRDVGGRLRVAVQMKDG